MKKTYFILSAVILALSLPTFANKNAPKLTKAQKPTAVKATKTTTPQKSKPITTNALPNYPLPLNKYGAIDVNAKVPDVIQIPPVPATFKPPKITTLAKTWPNYIPTPPALNVHSYLLMDAATGTYLAAYKPNLRLAPASLTKLMTLYITEHELAQNAIHLTDMITVPKVAWATGGSRMFLKPNDKVSLHDLILGIIVPSGNDAAVTLANYIAGTQQSFVSLMNQEVKKLKMTNTHFSDVMGLPAPNLFTSAHDMAMLAQAITQKYPQYLSWYSTKWFKHAGIKQPNFNRLLFIYKYAEGLKTGSTATAGYSLVSTAKKPGNPMRLIAVVMGGPTNNNTAAYSKALLTYGFRFFSSRLIEPANTAIKQEQVYFGAKDKINLGLANDLYVTLPTRLPNKAITTTIKINKPLKAPIKQGQELGTYTLTTAGKIIASVPLVALTSVPEGNFWQRLADHFKLWF